MRKLVVRRWSLIVAVILVALAFFINNQLNSRKKPPEQRRSFNTTPVVEVEVIENSMIQLNIPLTGRLVSKNRIEIFSEVTGRLLPGSKPFKEGTVFNKGDILLRLDDTDFRMSLVANRSNFHSQLTQLLADLKIDYPSNFENWKAYIDNFDPNQKLKELPETKNQQEKGFLVSRNIYNQYYNIKSQEAQLAKYLIIAPFTGIVSSAYVNPGSLIRAGQKIGEFLDPYLFELEVGIGVPDIDKIKKGSTVGLASNDVAGSWEGKISRISQSVDESTQTLKVYIDVYGLDLYEGLYLNADIGGIQVENASRIPSNIIFNDNNVYLVEDSKLKIEDVDIIHQERENTVVRGLPEGELLLNQVLAGSYEGMQVQISEIE